MNVNCVYGRDVDMEKEQMKQMHRESVSTGHHKIEFPAGKKTNRPV